MLTPAELEQWDLTGAVTVRTPLCDDPALLGLVQQAMFEAMPWDTEDAWGRPARPSPGRVTNTNLLTERSQPLIDVVQLEFFEQVAKQTLRTHAVTYCASALAVSYPEDSGTELRFGEHVDVQYTLEQWDATPRRAIVSFFIWLAEANAKRAPLMYRPGSHRVVASVNSTAGVRLLEDPQGNKHKHGSFDALLAATGISREAFMPPEPAVGPAGSATVTTTALVHGASNNVDDKPRFSMHLTFGATEFVQNNYDGILRFSFVEHWQNMLKLVRPNRRHIVCVEDPEAIAARL